MKKRVTIISVERERVIEIRWRGHSRENLCEQCASRTRLLTPDEAAVVAGVSPAIIHSLVEAGRLHFTKTSDGQALVCLNSLGRLVSK